MIYSSENCSYSVSSGVTVNRQYVKTSEFGFEAVSTIGAILWNDIPAELKNAESLKSFKLKIKLLNSNDCLCKTCTAFIRNLGYT